MWPFKKPPRHNNTLLYNLELFQVMPKKKVAAIRTQDAKDAEIYRNIERYCEDLRGVRQHLQSRRKKRG